VSEASVHMPVLVEFQRGGADRIETRHHGAIAVVDAGGQLLWQAGDAGEAYALRSTAKPFQLLPLLLDGLHEPGDAHPGSLEPADLAVMMSSHNGEPMHTERIAALLSRFGLAESALQCGVEAPALRADRERLLRANQPATSLHCNCSGKHTNMLAVCSRRGWPLDSYLDPQHPLQIRIRDILAALLGLEDATFPRSTDGCSLPTYWLSLAALARLFAYIAEPAAAPAVEGRSIEAELTLLRQVGMQHPDLIAGSGRLDTLLMSALNGRLFAKTGAAGLYAMALPAGPRVPRALGIAIKVEDGDPKSRIRASVVVEVLRQLGVVTGEDGELWDQVADIAKPTEHNFRGIAVGTYRPVFRLREA
jgi:L-asparaginase II